MTPHNCAYAGTGAVVAGKCGRATGIAFCKCHCHKPHVDEAPLAPAPRESAPLSQERVLGLIAYARETWRNDGAEGETVHRLCDELERRL